MSPVRRFLAPAPGNPDAEPLAILEPYLFVQTIAVSGAGTVIYGLIRPPGDGRPAGTAAAIRAALFGQAQAAIAAMEEAGWTHALHPEITIKGDIMRQGDEDGGDFPRAECWLRLDMSSPA